MRRLNRPWRRAAFALALILVLPTLWFGIRSYGSLQLLRSAYQAGAPQTGSIRGWMTLGYVARTYRVGLPSLMQNLGLAPDADPNTNLRAAAKQSGLSTFQYVERVQRAVAALAGKSDTEGAPEGSRWLAALGD